MFNTVTSTQVGSFLSKPPTPNGPLITHLSTWGTPFTGGKVLIELGPLRDNVED